MTSVTGTVGVPEGLARIESTMRILVELLAILDLITAVADNAAVAGASSLGNLDLLLRDSWIIGITIRSRNNLEAQ